MRAIITADWHIRKTKPRCRLDEDWNKTQENALNQIAELTHKYKCDVFVIGDIFNSNSDTSFENISLIQDFALNKLYYTSGVFILCGNHDLLYHSSENINKSAIGLLLRSENIRLISTLNDIENNPNKYWGSNFDEETKNREIIFKHILCFPDRKSLPPNVDALCAEELLDKYDNAKWIFTGDYHKNFHYEKNGRHIVNSGCLLRQATDLKDYQCGVYYVDTDEEIVEFIPIKDDYELVDDSYITRQGEREERIEAFVKKIGETESISLDFIDNVEKELMKNSYTEAFKELVMEFIECEKK